MKSKQAVENFKTMNSTQSVLTAFSEELGLDKKTALKIAAGFSSGLGNGGTCGAVTGACMVISLQTKTGKSLQEQNNIAKRKMQRFNQLFLEKYGSLQCKYLLGTDISTPEGLEKSQQQDLFNKVCPSLIETACKIIENEL